MLFVAIKVWPKDEAIKKELVDKINQVFLDVWGCPQEAMNVSLEEIAPEDWEETVKKPEIDPNVDKMMILDGQKKY